jgi:signal transduction histidine kinase
VTDLLIDDVARRVALRMREAHQNIASRWLFRLTEVVPVPAGDVFPGARLLDHIPDLVREIAGYLSAPEAEAIAANTAVIAKAQELGELRHAQEASVHQVVLEYRILGEILALFVRDEIAGIEGADALQCLAVMHRLHLCVGVLMQTTVDRFIGEYTATIQDQTRRLDSFNRMATHELRQPLAAIQYAVTALSMTPDAGVRDQLITAIDRSAGQMTALVRTLERVSRLSQADGPHQQRVEIGGIASQVARQLNEMAAARGVTIEVADDLPALVVDAGRLELVIINLLSNGIKYCDQAKPTRSVAVETARAASDHECAFAVRDNGLGIPSPYLGDVFSQFFRAHARRDQELGTDGIGLGLAIVADCVKAMGGRIDVSSVEGEGSVFTVTLPREAGQRT